MDLKDHLVLSLSSTMESKAWYGDPFYQVLNHIEFSYVNRNIEGYGHKTIAHIVQHIIAWQGFVIKKLESNNEYDIKIGSSVDWPNRNVTTIEEWQQLTEIIRDQNRRIITLIDSLNSMELTSKVRDKPYNKAYMIAGVIHHNLYHLGQITVLYKILKNTV